jgi:L-threonylcarbamoyladenylate synthase
LEEPEAVARELFKGLRALDELGLDAIVVEGIPEAREGAAVMNRLRKAAVRVVPV